MEWNYGESGGIGYHLAALRYAGGLWSPFRNTLGAELRRRLSEVPGQDARPLVLVGPSGGYCLSPEILKRSGPVLAVDVDRLARPIFAFRHRTRIGWRREDFFSAIEACDSSPAGWWNARGKGETPVFLFMNLLGQLEFIYSEVRLQEIERSLERFFDRAKEEKVPWISVHDRIAFSARDLRSGRENEPLRSNRRRSDEELAEAYGNAREIETHRIGAWVSRAKPDFAYLPWRLTTEQVLISEIASSSA